MTIYTLLLIAPLWILLNLAINRHVSRRKKHHLTSLPLDARFPFIPGFAILYLSAYILGILGLIIMLSHPDLNKVVWGYLFMVVTGSLFYLLFPSRVERHENLTVTGLSTYLLALFQRISGPYNVFPSLHAAYCLFSALVVWHYFGLWPGLGLTVWTGLVSLGTLLTKQHYILDIVSGIVLGLVVYMIFI